MTQPVERQWQWTAAGQWPGGSVLGIDAATGPGGTVRLLAATRAGLFLADGLAGEWRRVAGETQDPHVVAVTWAGVAQPWPAAFAATATGRLWRSDDGGESWAEVAAWAGLGVATVLAASPAFGEDGMLFVGTAEGIFRTLDRGASWESCTFGLLDSEVLCLGCAPDFAASQLLWAGTAGGGLYRSRNQARAWRESGLGLPDAAVLALAVSPGFTQDRTLYVGLEDHGVYRSRDGGESWQPAGDALAGRSVHALACLAGGLELVASSDAGLYTSGDGGVQWQAATDAPWVALALTWAGSGAVAAGAYQAGVLVSVDRGQSWRPAAGLAAHAPPVVISAGDRLVAVDADGGLATADGAGTRWDALAGPEGVIVFGTAWDGEQLWAATSEGLYRLAGVAGGWQPATGEGLPSGPLAAVDAAGAALLAVGEEGRLWLSQDAAATWQEVTGPWQEGGQSLLRGLVAVDTDGAVVVALTIRPAAQGQSEVSLWRRAAGSWANLAGLTTAIPAVLAAWPEPDDLYLATHNRVIRLYRARASGQWAAVQHLFGSHEQVTALTAYPASGAAGVWAATTAGIYYTPGSGAPWGQVAGLPAGLPVVMLDPQPGGVTAVTLGGQCWHGHPA